MLIPVSRSHSMSLAAVVILDADCHAFSNNETAERYGLLTSAQPAPLRMTERSSSPVKLTLNGHGPAKDLVAV